jgi:hypothetical protein
VNFKVIIIGFILAVIVGGWIIDSVGLNDVLTRQGPMQGMMREYMHDNYIQSNGQGWGRNRGD